MANSKDPDEMAHLIYMSQSEIKSEMTNSIDQDEMAHYEPSQLDL